MEMNTLTLDDLLLPEWEDASCAPFTACATYFEAMDCIVYLKEDESFRADRIDQFLTILWHPHDDRVIGIKIKGMRFLFNSIQTIVKSATGKDLANDRFIPLVSAVQMALELEAGAHLSATLERNRLQRSQEITASYEVARGIVDDAKFDIDQLTRVARLS